MEAVKKKLFSCFFLPDVLCSFRKNENFGVMGRCQKCTHYERFWREIDEEEEKFWGEVGKIRKYSYPRGID